jgi:hypothetical protein
MSTVSETTVHQLQLLAKDGRRAFVVTYSSSAKNFPTFTRAFEESLASFRLEREAEGPPGAEELKASAGFSAPPPTAGDFAPPASKPGCSKRFFPLLLRAGRRSRGGRRQ